MIHAVRVRLGTLLLEMDNLLIRRFFIVWWILATTLAVGVAAFVVALIPGPHGLVEGLTTGLIVGLVQWAILRAVGERLNAWPLATIAGWTVVGLLTPDWPVWAGPWIGMLQWLVIRHYTRDAGWWIIASAMGWLLAWWLEAVAQIFLTRGLRNSIASAMLGPDAYTSLPFNIITGLNWTIGALAYAIVTAFSLALILEPENERRPTPN